MKLSARTYRGAAGRGAGRRHAADRRLRRRRRAPTGPPERRAMGERRLEARPAPIAPDGGGGAPATGADGAAEGQREGDEAPGVQAGAPDYLSTFALDVDTASYGYARRTLADGQLPQPVTVRPEEFINSFRQDYPRPKGDGFSVTVDGARPGRGARGRSERAGGGGLVAGARGPLHPHARPQGRTAARRPHLRHRHLRLDGRAGPPRPRQGVAGDPHRRAARRRLDRTGHLQRRGQDAAADDPDRRQPRPDPLGDRQPGADRLHQCRGGREDGLRRGRRGPSARSHQPRRAPLRRARQHRRDRGRRDPRPDRRRPARVRHHALRRRRRQRATAMR